MFYDFPTKILPGDEVMPLGGDEEFPEFGGERAFFYTVKDGVWNDPSVWRSTGTSHAWPNSRHHSVLINHVITVPVTQSVTNVFNIRISGMVDLNNKNMRSYGEFWAFNENWWVNNGGIYLHGTIKGTISGKNAVYVQSRKIKILDGVSSWGIYIQVYDYLIVTGRHITYGLLQFVAMTRGAAVYVTDVKTENSYGFYNNGVNLLFMRCEIAAQFTYEQAHLIDSVYTVTDTWLISNGRVVTGENSVIRLEATLRLDYNGSIDVPVLVPAGKTGYIKFWYAAAANTGYPEIRNTVNGEDNNSILEIAGVSLSGNTSLQWFTFMKENQPMSTGQMVCLPDSHVRYGNAGAQEIKGTTYSHLWLTGGGVKKLMGDVIVTDSYTVDPGVTVDLNGFTLTN